MSCYAKFKVNEILYWRQKVHTVPEGPERHTKLIELLRLASVNLRKNEKTQLYTVDQKLICRKTFIHLVLKVSVSTFGSAKAAVHQGKISSANAKTKLTHFVRGKLCEGFIKAYIQTVCDRDPTTERYRMPVSLCRINIYSLYETIIKDDIVKQSRFYEILKKKFSHLSFNKTQRYTKCVICRDLRAMIERQPDSNTKLELEVARNRHIEEQQIEREAYYVRRNQAEMRPTYILSLIIDGLDQNKTNLPHYRKWTVPNAAGTERLRTHVTGSIVHGRGKYFFLDFRQYPHDTNLTLSCLLFILSKEAVDGKLPPTLYVQLDNTCRENKNKYFLGMMAYLVKKELVSEVYVSFLMVGHTHEDVDQTFSKISHSLEKRDVLTLNDLREIIGNSQTPLPTVKQMRNIWNISGWLEPCINQIHAVTYPHIYRSLKKDFKMAIFSEDQIEEWNSFLTEPFKDANDENWPLLNLTAYEIPTTADNLSEREKEIIEKYNLKSNLYKEVYTTQSTGQRGVYTDRRNYTIGEMALIKNGDQVKEVHGKRVNVLLYQKNRGSYFPTDTTERFDIEQCFPGSFKLTQTKRLPTKILERIEALHGQ